ncbi:MAG: GspH/FimT family pseudopilin [Phycisphaerae bacterium]|nr:GspH/FimT family pseudopilin [Phycisphaerae bacterium]
MRQAKNSVHDHAHRRLTAFSLLEVVVVMAVIATISAIAVPRYVSFISREKVEGAARRIAADLNWARQLARAKGTNFSVVFNSSRQQYYLYDVAADKVVAHPDHTLLPYKIDLAQDLDNVSLVTAAFGGDETVVFDAYGAADTAGSIVIQQGKWRQGITVKQAGGSVSIGGVYTFEPVPVDPEPITPPTKDPIIVLPPDIT